MSDEITLVLAGEVTLDDFAQVVTNLKGLMQSLSADVAEKAKVEWVQADLQTNGAVMTYKGHGPTEAVSRIVEAYGEVGYALQSEEPIPFSSQVAKHAKGIASVLNGQIPHIRFESSEFEAIIQAKQDKSLRIVEMPPAYGAVQGRIQTLSSRGSLRFTLYDILNDRPVSCYLAKDIEDPEEKMRDVWAKLALVEGLVRRDPGTNRVLTVREVRNIEVLPEPDLWGYQAARGIAPPVKSAITPENASRRLRDAL